MKIYPAIICSFGALLLAGCVDMEYVSAQPAPPPPPPVPPEVMEADPLEQLVAPIALYPDALVALILPASTSSADIVLADRYLQGGGDPNDVESRAWDQSVKGLAHYPSVVKWLNDNLDWTQQLGVAYVNEPDQVMAAVQRARTRARANGVLVDTAQQQVVVEDGFVRIVPAQPDVIYVPAYDPEIIYLAQPPDYYPGPLITYGVGFGVGFWLGYDCDWRGHAIWIDRHAREHWRDHDHHDWRRHEWPSRGASVPDPNWHTWHPAPNRPHPTGHDIDWAHHPVRRPVPPPQAPDFHHPEHGRPGDGPQHPGRPPEPAPRPGDRGFVPPAHGRPEQGHPTPPPKDEHDRRHEDQRPARPGPSGPPVSAPAPVVDRPATHHPAPTGEPVRPRPERPDNRPPSPGPAPVRVTPPAPVPRPVPEQHLAPAPRPEPVRPQPERREERPPGPAPVHVTPPAPAPRPAPAPHPEPRQEHHDAPHNDKDRDQDNRPDRDKKTQEH